MRYLVDSDWLIDAAIGRTRAQQFLDRLMVDGVAISIVSVCEAHDGAFGANDPEADLAGLREFFAPLTVLPLTDAIAERFARLRAGLRRRGMLIPDMDLLIAATAVEADLVLVSRNVRHFERIPELSIFREGQ